METESTTAVISTSKLQSRISLKKEKIHAKKVANEIVSQLSRKYSISNNEKREINLILGILMDSSLTIEERIRRISRTSVSGFANIIKSSSLEFAERYSVFIKKQKVIENSGLSGRGILSMTLIDFFDRKIVSDFVNTVKSRANREAQGVEVRYSSQEKRTNVEEKKSETGDSLTQRNEGAKHEVRQIEYTKKIRELALRTPQEITLQDIISNILAKRAKEHTETYTEREIQRRQNNTSGEVTH